MKFFAYSVSITGRMNYIGTWFADSYDEAMKIILTDTGMDTCSLRVYGKIV